MSTSHNIVRVSGVAKTFRMSFTAVKSTREQGAVQLADTAPYRGVLLKNMGWRSLPAEALGVLRDAYGSGAVVAPLAWLELPDKTRAPATSVRKGDRVETAQGVLGLSPAEADFGRMASPFHGLLWNQYLVQSDAAKMLGLTDLIPTWVAPHTDSDSLLARTFFHRDWLIPILLLVGSQIIQRIDHFGLGYALYRLTSDVEKLPFPMAVAVSPMRPSWTWAP